MLNFGWVFFAGAIAGGIGVTASLVFVGTIHLVR